MILYLLLQIPQGAKTAFDKKTHRRVWQRTNRITYTYYAAHFLEHRSPDEVAADVLAHLERTQQMMYQAWGQAEWNNQAGYRIGDSNENIQRRLAAGFGEARFQDIRNNLLGDLVGDERTLTMELLGRQVLTEIYRQLLVGVTSELWVDYLTQMEALRVSIGLEAYAQRDPLVQYKNRAFGLFQELVSNMRLGVVSRMFTYQPRSSAVAQATTTPADAGQVEASPSVVEGNGKKVADHDMEKEMIPEDAVASATSDQPGTATSQATGRSGDGKRKRRRHR
jgi:preprotein translocase subunit SecA